MANKTLTEHNIIITGTSYYTHSSKPNTSGQYPSNKFEVGIVVDPSTVDDRIKPYIKEKDGKSVLKIANSKYPFRIYDKSGERLDDKTAIKNDTKIQLALSIKYSEVWAKEFINVEGIKLLDDYKPYDPFNN